MPVKVSVRLLAIDTAGLAKEVEEVNQIADVIYEPTIEPTVYPTDYPTESLKQCRLLT